MFKRKKKDSAKEKGKRGVTKAERQHKEVIGGMLGDKDQRTKAGRHNLLSLLLALFLIVFGSIYFGIQHHAYSDYLANNTTPAGTSLQFTLSGNSLTLGDVWTDKAHDLIVAQLHYSTTAHQFLSSDGIHYKLYLETSGKKPKNLKMKYGLLGTDGGGYLFIQGKLNRQAYQVFLANKLSLSQDAIDNSATDSNDAASSSGTVTAALDSADLDKDSDNKGVFNFANNKNKSAATEDYINFRINPYSESTNVANESFINKQGNINYGKVVKAMATSDMTADLKKKIVKHKARINKLKATIKDYKQRLSVNKNDDIAGTGKSTAETSLKTENTTVQNLQKELDQYEGQKFNEKSFGEMQTKFTLLMR